MAKHLTPKDIDSIISLIDGWDGKLSWEALCDASEPVTGTRPTRQTLNAHERIKSAFSHKKEQLKNGFVSTKRPQSLSIAEQRIRRLESENSRLKAENANLLEQFLKWQYNAYKHGLSKEKLDADLPAIDRDSSERK